MKTDIICTTRKEFSRYCRLVYRRGLASGVGGNAAVRNPDHFFLTPSGLSLRDMEPAKVSVVDGNGSHVGGPIPSRETDLHLRIFQERSDVNAILHLHGPYMIAASTLLAPGPDALPPLTPGFVHLVHPLPMLHFCVPGSQELAQSVTKAFRSSTRHAILLQNHGLIAAGRDLKEALNIAEEVDEAARVYVLTQGRAQPILMEDVKTIHGLP